MKMELDEKGVEVARKATALQFPGTWMDEMCLTFTRAYLSALPSSPVSELVDELKAFSMNSLMDRTTATLTSLSTRNAELERGVKRLREALFVADDTIMTLHGCFPLDRVSKEDVRLNEAAKAIRSFTSDDYYERKRIVDAFFAALSTSPQGGEHGE